MCYRFIAVTWPLTYNQYRNSARALRRVGLMLAAVWTLSVAISSPIALGNQMNSSPDSSVYCVHLYFVSLLFAAKLYVYVMYEDIA